MLLDLNQKFVSIDGRVVKDVVQNGNKDIPGVVKDLTLLRVTILALMDPPTKLSDDDKVKYFELCLKVMANKAGTVEITSEEITLIKAAIKPKFGVLLVGEAMRMLEGRDIGIEIISDKQPLDEYYDEQESEEDLGGQEEDLPQTVEQKLNKIKLPSIAAPEDCPEPVEPVIDRTSN